MLSSMESTLVGSDAANQLMSGQIEGDVTSAAFRPEVAQPGYLFPNREWDSTTPLWLIPAGRSPATEGYASFEVIPKEARTVAVGRHDFLPISAIAWVSEGNEIVVTVEATALEAGRDILVRVWSRENGTTCRAAALKARNGRTIAEVNMGSWDGLPIAGLTLISLIQAGEEW
jgi:hypothetical protein